MLLGEYEITKSVLMKSKHENLIRLAKWAGLRYGLLDMSHEQLAKLIRWRLTRGKVPSY